MRIRTPREHTSTANICVTIRGAVRPWFTLSRTRPRRIAACRVEQSSACTRLLDTLRHKGISKFWAPKHVPKTVTIACASKRRLDARRRPTSAWQVVGPHAKGSHLAAQGRGASRRDGSNKAERAQDGLALSVTRVSFFWALKRVPKTLTIVCGTEPSVNARRRLKSARQFGEGVRQGFTLGRTAPRGIAA